MVKIEAHVSSTVLLVLGVLYSLPFTYPLAKVDRPAVIQYEPNERGILRCQAWSVPEMSIEPIAPSLSSKNKKFKIQYPNRIQYEYKDKYEIYCPRCDIYFHNRVSHII